VDGIIAKMIDNVNIFFEKI